MRYYIAGQTLSSLDESLPDGKGIKVHLVGSIADDLPAEIVGVSDRIISSQLS